MSLWRQEFGPSYEVPKFIDYLVSQKVLEDSSWHNDSSPSFGLRQEVGNHSQEVRLWVGHPFKSRREFEGDRFGISFMKDDESTFEHNTDDLDDALLTLFNQLAEYHQGLVKNAFDWVPEGALDTWDDPVDYLDTLKKAYLRDPQP